MRKPLLVLALIAASLGFISSNCEAKSFSIGDKRPVATVTIPDSWKTETIENGIEATSPDEEISLAIEAVEIKDVEQATREGIKYFADQGVKIDPSTQKQSETKMSGKPAIDISWKGKDDEGNETNVGLTFVILSEKDSVLLYFWGDDESIKLNAPALQSISESIRSVQQ